MNTPKVRLYGAKEIRMRIPYSRSMTHRIVNEDGFPVPYDDTLASGRLWVADEVDEWIKANILPSTPVHVALPIAA